MCNVKSKNKLTNKKTTTRFVVIASYFCIKIKLMHNIANLFIEQIGKTFFVFPDNLETQKLRQLLTYYKQQGWNIVFPLEVQDDTQVVTRRFYNSPKKMAEHILLNNQSIYHFLVNHLQFLKEQSINNNNFDNVATLHYNIKELLEANLSSREEIARNMLPHYTSTLFVSILVTDHKISIYLNFNQYYNNKFLEFIQSL